MMNSRGGGEDSRAASLNNAALETINAAATAIAAAENRAPQATPVQKKRWGGCWISYWCFGSPKNHKRIGHAVISPESSSNDVSAAQTQTLTTTIALPFVAPPSSPASIFQSAPPSVTQSPNGLLSLTSVSASMYSPSGPHSIFAIGPYANETQLVSPPVFSTFTTEPSTAPFTPPSESFQLTNPSSPEVPFAQLLDPNSRNSDGFPRFPFYPYEFPCYQLSPGSPMGHLISPSSVFSVSGTSSPFAGRELPSIPPNFLDFLANKSPKLLELEDRAAREWGSRPGSGSVTPDAAGLQSLKGCLRDCENDHADIQQASLEKDVVSDETKESETSTCTVEEAPIDSGKQRRHQRYRSITLGSSRDFNFDKIDQPDAATNKPNTGSASSSEEKAPDEENGATKNWSFPVIQPSVS